MPFKQIELICIKIFAYIRNMIILRIYVVNIIFYKLEGIFIVEIE